MIFGSFACELQVLSIILCKNNQGILGGELGLDEVESVEPARGEQYDGKMEARQQDIQPVRNLFATQESVNTGESNL